MARCWMKSRGRRACSGPSARCRLSGKQHAARARSKSKPSGLATVRFACRRFERMLSGIKVGWNSRLCAWTGPARSEDQRSTRTAGQNKG